MVDTPLITTKIIDAKGNQKARYKISDLLVLLKINKKATCMITGGYWQSVH